MAAPYYPQYYPIIPSVQQQPQFYQQPIVVSSQIVGPATTLANPIVTRSAAAPIGPFFQSPVVLSSSAPYPTYPAYPAYPAAAAPAAAPVPLVAGVPQYDNNVYGFHSVYGPGRRTAGYGEILYRAEIYDDRDAEAVKAKTEYVVEKK